MLNQTLTTAAVSYHSGSFLRKHRGCHPHGGLASLRTIWHAWTTSLASCLDDWHNQHHQLPQTGRMTHLSLPFAILFRRHMYLNFISEMDLTFIWNECEIDVQLQFINWRKSESIEMHGNIKGTKIIKFVICGSSEIRWSVSKICETIENLSNFLGQKSLTKAIPNVVRLVSWKQTFEQPLISIAFRIASCFASEFIPRTFQHNTFHYLLVTMSLKELVLY